MNLLRISVCILVCLYVCTYMFPGRVDSILVWELCADGSIAFSGEISEIRGFKGAGDGGVFELEMVGFGIARNGWPSFCRMSRRYLRHLNFTIEVRTAEKLMRCCVIDKMHSLLKFIFSMPENKQKVVCIYHLLKTHLSKVQNFLLFDLGNIFFFFFVLLT